MLFVESRILNEHVDGATRILLLDKLTEKGFIPLIRSMRLDCYAHALLGTGRIVDMERSIAARTEAENEIYIQGELFCFDNYVHFLVFEETHHAPPVIRVGIVYHPQTSAPLRKLDTFCQDIQLALAAARGGSASVIEAQEERNLATWERGKPLTPSGFMRFIGRQDIDALYQARRQETVVERKRAAELLEDASTRNFLRRSKEAHIEGCTAKLLSGEKAAADFSTDNLLNVGLVRREVLVSCRQTGHTLFLLPSADALAVVTVSHATCSECGAPVADERIEEIIAPTPLASRLLEDGSWLINRHYTILRELGLPDSEIAIGTPTGEGEAHIMANVCGESFLLVLRDGDLTPAFARRAIDLEVETEAAHLLIVATGRINKEGRLRLHEHARRLARDGREVELMIVDGAVAAASELRRSFESVSQRVLGEQLCELDAHLGMSVSRMLISRFQLLNEFNEESNIGRSTPDVGATDERSDRTTLLLPVYSVSGPGETEDHSEPFSINRDHFNPLSKEHAS